MNTKKKKRKIIGTKIRPRISVFRSLNHICAQIIDDTDGITLASASTHKVEGKKKNNSNIAMAKVVGLELAKNALAKGISLVVFDRGKYRYHGSIKALADAAREGGLKF